MEEFKYTYESAMLILLEAKKQLLSRDHIEVFLLSLELDETGCPYFRYTFDREKAGCTKKETESEEHEGYIKAGFWDDFGSIDVLTEQEAIYEICFAIKRTYEKQILGAEG